MDGNRQGLLDLALPDLLAASDGVLRSWPTEYYRSNGKVLLLRVLSHFTEQCLLWVEAQADAGAVESAQQLRDDVLDALLHILCPQLPSLASGSPADGSPEPAPSADARLQLLPHSASFQAVLATLLGQPGAATDADRRASPPASLPFVEGVAGHICRQCRVSERLLRACCKLLDVKTAEAEQQPLSSLPGQRTAPSGEAQHVGLAAALLELLAIHSREHAATEVLQDQQDDVPDAVMAVARIVSAGRMSEAALQTERWGSEHPALQQWRKRTADATRKPIFEALCIIAERDERLAGRVHCTLLQGLLQRLAKVLPALTAGQAVAGMHGHLLLPLGLRLDLAAAADAAQSADVHAIGQCIALLQRLDWLVDIGVLPAGADAAAIFDILLSALVVAHQRVRSHHSNRQPGAATAAGQAVQNAASADVESSLFGDLFHEQPEASELLSTSQPGPTASAATQEAELDACWRLVQQQLLVALPAVLHHNPQCRIEPRHIDVLLCILDLDWPEADQRTQIMSAQHSALSPADAPPQQGVNADSQHPRRQVQQLLQQASVSRSAQQHLAQQGLLAVPGYSPSGASIDKRLQLAGQALLRQTQDAMQDNAVGAGAPAAVLQLWANLAMLPSIPAEHHSTADMAWVLHPARLALLLLSSHALSADQQALAAAMLMQATCGTARGSAASLAAAERPSPDAQPTQPAGTAEPQQAELDTKPTVAASMWTSLFSWASRAVLTSAVHYLLVHAAGAPPDRLVQRVGRVLQGVAEARPDSLFANWAVHLANDSSVGDAEQQAKLRQVAEAAQHMLHTLHDAPLQLSADQQQLVNARLAVVLSPASWGAAHAAREAAQMIHHQHLSASQPRTAPSVPGLRAWLDGLLEGMCTQQPEHVLTDDIGYTACADAMLRLLCNILPTAALSLPAAGAPVEHRPLQMMAAVSAVLDTALLHQCSLQVSSISVWQCLQLSAGADASAKSDTSSTAGGSPPCSSPDVTPAESSSRPTTSISALLHPVSQLLARLAVGGQPCPLPLLHSLAAAAEAILAAVHFQTRSRSTADDTAAESSNLPGFVADLAELLGSLQSLKQQAMHTVALQALAKLPLLNEASEYSTEHEDGEGDDDAVTSGRQAGSSDGPPRHLLEAVLLVLQLELPLTKARDALEALKPGLADVLAEALGWSEAPAWQQAVAQQWLDGHHPPGSPCWGTRLVTAAAALHGLPLCSLPASAMFHSCLRTQAAALRMLSLLAEVQAPQDDQVTEWPAACAALAGLVAMPCACASQLQLAQDLLTRLGVVAGKSHAELLAGTASVTLSQSSAALRWLISKQGEVDQTMACTLLGTLLVPLKQWSLHTQHIDANLVTTLLDLLQRPDTQVQACVLQILLALAQGSPQGCQAVADALLESPTAHVSAILTAILHQVPMGLTLLEHLLDPAHGCSAAAAASAAPQSSDEQADSPRALRAVRLIGPMPGPSAEVADDSLPVKLLAAAVHSLPVALLPTANAPERQAQSPDDPSAEAPMPQMLDMLLALVIRSAAGLGLSGLRVLLTFPAVLVARLPDFLAQSEGAQQAAEMLPILRFVQAVVQTAALPAPAPELGSPLPPAPTHAVGRDEEGQEVVSQADAATVESVQPAAAQEPPGEPGQAEPHATAEDSSSEESADDVVDIQAAQAAEEGRQLYEEDEMVFDDEDMTEAEEESLAAVAAGLRAEMDAAYQLLDDRLREAELQGTANPELRRAAGYAAALAAADAHARALDAGIAAAGSGGEARRSQAAPPTDASAARPNVCTFISSGEAFVEQHWYFCYTCGLVDSKGCCSVCAQVCHAGHDLVYSGKSRFFCDCGAGVPGCPQCKCLQPVQLPARQSEPVPAATPAVEEELSLPGDPFAMAWEWDPYDLDQQGRAFESLEESLPGQEGQDVFDQQSVLSAAAGLRPVLANLAGTQQAEQSSSVHHDSWPDLLSQATTAMTAAAQLLLTKLREADQHVGEGLAPAQAPTESPATVAVRSAGDGELVVLQQIVALSGLDPKPTGRGADRTNAAQREVADAVVAGVVRRSGLSCSQALGLLAVARGSNLALLDAAAAARQITAPAVEGEEPPTVSSLAVCSQQAARFDIVHVAFDSLRGRYLLVAGLHTLQVWTVDTGAKVTDRLPVPLPELPGMPSGVYADIIVKVEWVPGQDTWLAVTVPGAVHIYDLSLAANMPRMSVRLPDNQLIASSTVALAQLPGQNLTQFSEESAPPLVPGLTCILLSRDGQVFLAKLPAPHDLPPLDHTRPSSDGPAAATPHQLRAAAVQIPDSVLSAAALSTDGSGEEAVASSSTMSSPASQSGFGRSIHYSAAAQSLVVCLGGSGSHNNLTMLTRLSADGGGLEQWAALESRSDETAGAVEAVTEVPLLPLSRQAVKGATLFAARLSDAAAAVLTVCHPASPHTSSKAACDALKQAISMQSSSRGHLEGAAGLLLPSSQHTLLVLLCGSGHLHLFTSALPEGAIVCNLPEPVDEHPATFNSSTAPQPPAAASVAEDGSSAAARLLMRRSSSSRRSSVSFQPHQLLDSPTASSLRPASFLVSRSQLADRTGSSTLSAELEIASMQSSRGHPSSPSAAAGAGGATYANPRTADATAQVHEALQIFEGSTCITSDTRLAGDVAQAGGGEGARQSLTEASRYLESASPAGMHLTIRNQHASLIIIGIRVRVGGSGSGHAPRDCTLAGQRFPFLAAGPSRWYSLPLTAALALQAHPEVQLQVGAACSPGLKSRIDSLEVYGRPLDQLSAPAQPAAAGAASAGSGSVSVGTAAVSLPGHLVSPAMSAVACEYMLSQALHTVRALVQVQPAWPCLQLEARPALQATDQLGIQAEKAGSAGWVAIDLLVLPTQLAAYWLPSGFVTYAAWALLHTLAIRASADASADASSQPVAVDAGAIYLTRDMRCLHEARLALTGCSAAWEASGIWLDSMLQHYLVAAAQVLSVSLRRPHNLQAYLGAAADNDQLAGHLTRLAPSALAALQLSSAAPCLPDSFLRNFTSCLVDVLDAYAHHLTSANAGEQSAPADSQTAAVAPAAALAAALCTCGLPCLASSVAGDLKHLLAKNSSDDTTARFEASIDNAGLPAARQALASALAGRLLNKLAFPTFAALGRGAAPAMQLLSSLARSSLLHDSQQHLAGLVLSRLPDVLADHPNGGVDTPDALPQTSHEPTGFASRRWRAMLWLLLAQTARAASECSSSKAKERLTAPASTPQRLSSEALGTFSKERLAELLLQTLQSAVAEMQKMDSQAKGVSKSNGAASLGTAPGYGELLSCQASRDSACSSIEDSFKDVAPSAIAAYLENVPRCHAEAVVIVASSLQIVPGGEDWAQALCAAAMLEPLADVRKPIRELLLSACGGHTAYRDLKAKFLLGLALKDVRAAAERVQHDGLSYAAAADLLRALKLLYDTAGERSRCWLAWCRGEANLLPWLVRGALSWSPGAAKHVLALLNLLLPSTQDAISSRADKLSLDLDLSWLLPPLAHAGPASTAAAVPAPQQACLLGHFIAALVLGSPDKEMRQEACVVLAGLWRHACLGQRWGRSLPASNGGLPVPVQLLRYLLSWLPYLPPYGQAAAQFWSLLKSLIAGEEDEAPKTKSGSRSASSGGTSSSSGSSSGGRKAQPSKQGSGRSSTQPHKAAQDAVHAVLGQAGGVVAEVMAALAAQNGVLSDHPHAQAYRTLQTLVQFSGYYLDPEGEAMPMQEPVFKALSLDNLEAETKYTADSITVRLNGRYLIKSFTLAVRDVKRVRSLRSLQLSYCSQPVAELSEVKSRPDSWRQAGTLHLRPGQSDIKQVFSVPVNVSCIRLHFTAFWQHLGDASTEVLHCPRCSHIVHDPHGVCRYCHENAYQCRHCRNINYESLDGFLCNECGHSRFGRFVHTVWAAASPAYPALAGEEDLQLALTALETETQTLQHKHAALAASSRTLMSAFTAWREQAALPEGTIPGPPGTARTSRPAGTAATTTASAATAAAAPPSAASAAGASSAITALASLYNDRCRAAHEGLVQTSQSVQGIRQALTQYLHAQNSASLDIAAQPVRLAAGGNAYRCAELFTEEAVSLLGSMLAACPVPVARSLHAGGAVKELFLSNLKNGTPDALRQARQLLAGVAKHKPSAAHELLMLIRERVLYCVVQHQALDVGAAVRTEMLLLEALCSQSGADLSTWQAQLFLVFQLLLKASATRSPAVSEHIILRCLNILVAALGSSAPATASPPRTTTRTTHQANMDRAVDALEEDAGALVTMSGFQAGSAGMADYLERRNQLAARLASGKAQQRATRLALRMGRRWLRTTHQRRQGASNGMHTGGEGGGGGAGLLLESPQLLSALLLNESLGQVRELAVTLLQRLGLHSAHMRTRLAARLAGLLPDATLAGMTGGKLFDMLADLAGDATVAAYLGAQGVMSSLVGQIGLLVLKLLAAEHGMPVPADPRLAALFGVADASHSPAGSGSGNALGYSLKRLVDLLAHLLAAPQGRPRFQRAQLLGPSLLAVAGLGSLVVGRTTLTGEAESTLEQLLQQSWLAGDVESRRDALQAGMRTLRQVWECSDQNPLAGALLARIPAGLLDQMSWAIAPAPAETIYLLNLDKSASQEEFIRGAMTHNPYSTAEVGPLMRDVKNYICSHLDLAGLLDDDFGMELLVGGNIIALSLPVRLVFECVWMAGGGAGGAQTPAAAATPASRSELDVIGPPMPITYRLQGLDGEATEPMISQLQEPNAQALDPETDFAVADVLASPQLDALPLLLQQLFRKSHGPATSQTALLRLLHQATHLQVCRQQLLAHGGLQQLLEHVQRVLHPLTAQLPVGAGNRALTSKDDPNSMQLMTHLEILERLAAQAAATSDAPTDLKVDVSALAAGLKALLQHGLSACAEVLAHILPHLARHSAAAQAALLAHFARSLDLNALDAGAQLPQQQEQEYELQSFLRLAQSVDEADTSGSSFRSLVLQHSIPQRIAAYLTGLFHDLPGEPQPPPGSSTAAAQAHETIVLVGRDSPIWSTALARPGLPMALHLLQALVKGHQATAGCVAGQALLLPLLHQLEGVSGIDVKLGMAAEELLDGLVEAGGPQVASAIAALRTATRMRQKELADRRRQEMLASLGMQQVERAGGSQLLAVATPASSELARALEEVGEADSSSLTCMVCKEGYGAKPADLLAAYCYCKRVPTSQVPGFTQPANTTGQLHCTVSHFNLIHVSCHAAARRADANLRVPKTEWDGASLRNGTTLANNLLPVRGSRVSTSSYMAAVNTFFDNLSSSGRLARSRSSPPASPALDAARVSAVATDLALLLQRFAFGLSFSEDCHGGGKESNACILPYLLQMGRYLADNATTERLQGLMAYAEELAQWPPSNVAAAPPIPYFLALSLLLQSSSQWASVRRSALLNAVHFSLHGAPSSFVAMEVAIHELYAKCAPMMRFFGMVHKLHSLLQQPRSSSSDWVADMEARLLDVNIMTQSVDEFLEFVHDMEGATDAMELLDIIGVTEDALREHATCDTFLVSAMTLDASA